MAPGISLRRRMLVVLILTILAFVVLVGRLGWVQLVQGQELGSEALDIRLREIKVEAKRGTMYDRNGRELVVSVNVDSVYAVPAQIPTSKRGAVAKALAEVLGLDEASVMQKLSRRESFVYIKRQVTDEQSQKIKELDLPGIGLTQDVRRFYPKGNLGSHVLGFTGIDNQGLNGVEVSFEKQLAGRPGAIVVEFDARGRELPQAVHQYVSPVDGFDLYLTIDEVIQFIAERELDKVMAETRALKSAIIVMDPSTGEVLALALRPDFDPNRWSEYPQEVWRNFAVSDSYSPGSTFKPITAAAALEEGVVSWNSRFYCPGYIKVPGAVIGCVSAHGSLDLKGIIRESCNVGFVNVGFRLGQGNFYKYVDLFNLRSKTGINLPGEGVGIFPPLKDVKPVDLAVMAFGQTLTLTPIQLLTALSAIVNDGVLMKPMIAREFRTEDGKVAQKFEPEQVRRVISSDTAAELKEALVAVVEDGTGTRAQVPGYKVGGKTGTAQKVVNGRIVEGKYVSYFFGFAPAQKPRLSVLVLIDEPQGPYYGGLIAAPVAGRVIQDVLRYLEVVPDAPPEPEIQQSKTKVPSVVNLPISEAIEVLKKAGLKVKREGEGGVVTSQVPPAGVEVPVSTAVLLKTGASSVITTGKVTVPNLTGKTVREAADLLGVIGLQFLPEGSGIAKAQDPVAGTKVLRGTAVKVKFE